MVEFTKMREEEGKDDLKYRVSYVKSCFFNSHLTSEEHLFY